MFCHWKLQIGESKIKQIYPFKSLGSVLTEDSIKREEIYLGKQRKEYGTTMFSKIAMNAGKSSQI